VTTSGAAVWDRLERMPHQALLAEGPGRKVVRYADRPEQDGMPADAIVAKYYADGQGATTAHTMDAVCAALHTCRPPAILSTPRPLGYDPDRRLLLQEPVPGVRFDALLSGPDALDSLRLAGRALADLHALAVPIGPPLRTGDHLRHLFRPHPAELALALPELGGRVTRVLQVLLQTETAVNGDRCESLVHRDVHPKQLFREDDRICLIDWDLAARGDGALDLGNFSAYLRARRGMGDEARDALLRGYAETGCGDVLERVPIYEALTCLRLACKRFRLGEDGWRDGCRELIGRAERTLGMV
jgi:aminoglycoside phosphotransferase (APT) family kinase protein